MKEIMSLSFPLGSDKMTTVRLATGGVCSLAGLDFDAVEDCKVSVTESLLLLMHRGYARAKLSFYEDDADGALLVCASGEGEGSGEPSEEDEISFALLGALNDGLETVKKDGRLAEISFRCGKKA